MENINIFRYMGNKDLPYHLPFPRRSLTLLFTVRLEY